MKKIVLVFLLCSISAMSQVVCDLATGNPIENVTIISNDFVGTITNAEGIFTLDYFDEFEFLELSHLGFQTKEVRFNDIKAIDTLFLKPLTITLDEVILESFNARDSILKVISKIPLNYYSKPFNLHGFFRQSITEDTVGVSMTEVSFISENSTIDSKQFYSTKIMKGRRSENHTAFGLDMIGGVLSLIQQMDLVRKKKGVFNEDNLLKYNFEYGGTIEKLNGDKTYIIDYAPANDDMYNNKFGQLFIDSETLAVIEFNTSRDTIKQKKILEDLNPKIFKSKKAIYLLQAATGVVKYRKINGLYYMSFIDLFNTREGAKKGERHVYEMNAKMIVTKVNTTNIIKVNTNYNPKKGFDKQVKKVPRLDYWNENNTLYFSKRERRILKDIKNVHR